MIPRLVVLLLAAVSSLPAQNGDDGLTPLELSLFDSVQRAVRSNYTIARARLDAAGVVQSYGESWGQFDPAFFVDTTGSQGTTAPNPNVVIVDGVPIGVSPAVESVFFDIAGGLRGMFLSGTTYQLDLGATRSNVVTFGSDEKTGRANFSLTHPLLKNGYNGYVRKTLDLASRDALIAVITSDDTTEDTILIVVTAYWNLVFAIQNLGTKEVSVQLAAELVDITQRKFDQGLQNRIDVTQVEAQLAEQREELLTADNLYEFALDDLRQLVLVPEALSEWDRAIQPVTEPSGIIDTASINLSELIDIALAERPDVRAARLRVQRAEIELERAETQILPRLDVTGTYGRNSNTTRLSKAIDGLNPDFDRSSLTLNFEVPIGNRTAGYALRRAQLERQSAGVGLREATLNAISEVRDAARNLILESERVVATAETTRLNKEVYDGERRRLENDLSTPYQVREKLRDWLDAIDVELRSRLDLEIAKATLAASQGRLLSEYAIPEAQPMLPLDQRPPAP